MGLAELKFFVKTVLKDLAEFNVEYVDFDINVEGSNIKFLVEVK
jgi:hypothetical protein